ncbi:MAG: DUF423 domain-containing protein [Verrucomicrobiota bacterium]
MYLRLAAFFGLTGVILGALGAHGTVYDQIVANDPLVVKEGDLVVLSDRLTNWKTGVFYQLIHSVAMMALAVAAPLRRVPILLWTAGILLFCGSLYILSLTSIPWLAPLTPVGGLLLMGGWAWLLLAPSPSPALSPTPAQDQD